MTLSKRSVRHAEFSLTVATWAAAGKTPDARPMASSRRAQKEKRGVFFHVDDIFVWDAKYKSRQQEQRWR